MPSLRHEGLVELVRQHPPLAAELARITGAFSLPAAVTAVLGSEDMSDVTPPNGHEDPKPQKYTADAVAVIADVRTGTRLVAVIVEPQGRDDDDKDEAWPCYVTNARRANKCPAATLIVLCWSKTAAAKCRRLIRTGHRGFDLAPWVLGPDGIPDGAADPYLVLCSALLRTRSLTTDDGRHRVLQAIRDSGASAADRKTLSRIILGVASIASRKRLEELMAVTYRSPFIESWEEKGRTKTKAEDLLEVLEVRGLRPTAKQRAKIAASTDLEQLGTWFRRALTASSIDEVFAG